jgi:hypothetical protein
MLSIPPERTVTYERADRSARIALCSAIVFLIGLAALGWDIDRDGIAATYSDPISHIRAQDEAIHVNSAIRMTQDGDWLTPKLMGRLFLFKPPLLIWLSALSIRIFGLSLFAVRLPALILGAAGVAAVFAWAARARSLSSGFLAAGVLLCSPLWQTFSRLCYTDVPASACAALALIAVVLDPQLLKARTWIAFGCFGAASVLAKSVAGALPFAALALYCIAVEKEQKPRLANVAKAVLTAAVLLAPWYIYQALLHPQWFWADHIQVQLLGLGLRPERRGILDLPIVYYLSRIVEMDPVLSLLAFAGIVGSVRWLRLRQHPATLLAACWTFVTLAALCAFQAKNSPYVVFILPPLCILGAALSPRFLDRHAAATACAVVLLLFGKAAVSDTHPWSLRPAAPELEGARAMRAYYHLHRAAELISVETDDQFYSATIPLPRVRYCFLDPSGWVRRFAPHYPALGITLTAEQFIAIRASLPDFAKRLREWGLNSTEPVGTAITLRDPSELAAIVQARPESDFYIPTAWTMAADPGRSHQTVPYSSARAFLFSRTAGQRTLPVPAIPARW